jgi:hypothetical protein
MASADLRARTIGNFKEALRHRQEAENHIEQLQLFLKDEYQRCIEKADSLDNSNKK